MPKTAFLFPGQGAQFVGMGRELDQELPAARALFDQAGEILGIDRGGAATTVVVEVQNTYGGRHGYLLRPDSHGYAEVDKALYVSPFHSTDGRYEIHVGEPGESVSLRVTLRRDGHEPFVATLRGQRREVTGAEHGARSPQVSQRSYQRPDPLAGNPPVVERPGGATALSTDLLTATGSRWSPVDLRRWPAMSRPKPAPLRARGGPRLDAPDRSSDRHPRPVGRRPQLRARDRSCSGDRGPLGLLHPARAGWQDRIR